MIAALFIPVGLQALAMVVDEGWYHRKRGLPRWERIGHPLDTLTIAICLGWLVAMPPARGALPVYVALAIFSTLFVTKDEAVHARLCTAGEHWLHSILFVLHPIVLAAFALIWWSGGRTIVIGQLAVTLAFLGYQVIYWNVLPWLRRPRAVNNAWYGELGARWHDAQDTPIALLRAEARHRNPWIAAQLGTCACDVLDLACGAGFLSNYLAERGHRVTGLDQSAESLAVAAERDAAGTVSYRVGDAIALPFPDASFDVVCAMDLLEHVEDPDRVIAEIGRVLRPGGLFFFHTFNRTWQANLVVIRGVEWFVKNVPENLHVLRLFLQPGEVASMCRAHGLEIEHLTGSRPRFRWPLWRMLLTGKVGDDFEFMFTPSTKLGYTGFARRSARALAGTELRDDELQQRLRQEASTQDSRLSADSRR
jgi:2-polyprenyl-6-hydroxyphenyl methylase / 3-demethylubiquinone-9 3-methyltransferase